VTDPSIYTIGHSNRSFRHFVALLQAHAVGRLMDVRRHPGSRTFPHFNRHNLWASLARRGIDYTWMEELGGRRRNGPGGRSPHVALYSRGFRNYADHMSSEPFRRAVGELEDLARGGKSALMCAERFFWKCHRRLLSDYLVARGWCVLHILGPGEVREHELSDMARISDDGELIYDVYSADDGTDN